jgi:hypothetical protein
MKIYCTAPLLSKFTFFAKKIFKNGETAIKLKNKIEVFLKRNTF